MTGKVPKAYVLVVDDDPIICKLITITLKASGFVSQSCTCGEDAIELLAKEHFDAVISDLNMPGVSGFELLAATRRLRPHAVFMMATGVSDVSVGVAAMKQGAADFLLKPFQMDAVVVSLQRALDVKRMEGELENYRKRLEEMVAQRTKQLEAALRRIEATYDETLEALAGALDLRDNATAGHSRRVTLYSLEIAKVMRLSRDETKQLERGACLHDIGKIGIPDAILLKPGKLTPDEKTVMQSHVKIGSGLVSRVAFLAPASHIVLSHQECFNGTGYPQGLVGEEIPVGARIFAVADTLDAILSDRPYRKGRPYPVARAIIAEESGKQFDPKVVSAFLSIPETTWERIRVESAPTLPDIRHAPFENRPGRVEVLHRSAKVDALPFRRSS
jgi:response regulator RpfG family c-di-GMP phosphodiesterase